MTVEKRAILVLGMHRSGTSALTRIINLMGVTAPRTLLPPTPENALGYWESAVLSALSEEVLMTCGSAWSSARPLREDPAAVTRRTGLDMRLRDALLSEFGDASLIVLKDPRVSRLMGVYEPILAGLGYRTLPIIALRNPAEVVASAMKRDGFRHRKAVRLWLRYTLDAERATRGRPRAVVAYDDLLQDWRAAIKKLATHLDVTWPVLSPAAEAAADAFISPSLRHHVLEQPTPGGFGRAALVSSVFNAMRRLAADPADPKAMAAMNRAALWFRLA